MSVPVHCEKCGCHFSVTRGETGRLGKCPQCRNPLYIPTPAEDLDELPLTSESSEEQREQARLEAERRRLDRMLAHEKPLPAESSAAAPQESHGGIRGDASTEPHAEYAGRVTVKAVVLAYLGAMRDADLERAEQAMQVLKNYRPQALRIVDRLAGDQIPPPGMANLPAPVYQGFLKSLRGQLHD